MPARTTTLDLRIPKLCPGPPTRLACEAAALLGAVIDTGLTDGEAPEGGTDNGATKHLADRPGERAIRLEIAPGRISVVLGPSGSGKTTLLRAAAWAAREQNAVVSGEAAIGRGAGGLDQLHNRPSVDLVAAALVRAGVVRRSDADHDRAAAACRALASVGLAELGAFVRRPSELSAGQRERLKLCLALIRATPWNSPGRGKNGGAETCGGGFDDAGLPRVLLLDEFAGTLDRYTAEGLAVLLRRRVAAAGGLHAIVATPRAELVDLLEPAQVVRLDATGRATVETPADRGDRAEVGDDVELEIGRGTWEDYRRLAPLHYRPGDPAVADLVLAARCGEELAGVLVVSMPTLNGAWRDLAWPGRFSGSDKRERSSRLNAELRCISRVIVDPRFRARGVARRLVGAYLASPRTVYTEAVAAMGGACPFFERAGMAAYRVPPCARHTRLVDALHTLGVEKWRLAHPDDAFAHARRASPAHVRRDGFLSGEAERAALLERELRRWARSSGATARYADEPLRALLVRAAGAIGGEPMAYAWTAGAGSAARK